MGSFCSGAGGQENILTSKYCPIVTKNDIHFPSRKFIQENFSYFHEIYKQLGPPLGCGGFGAVWKCEHKRTGDIRAVKIIEKITFTLEEIESRSVFMEVEILKTLDHPNVVKVFEYFEDDSNYYIVMELIQGCDLYSYIESNGKMPESHAKDVMKKLFCGINYLHSRKVAHRDIKPENVLLQQIEISGHFDLKIIDFNVSSFKKDRNFDEPVGTTDYMAPEVFNDKYDEKCDMWSCGVILYLVVSGYLPFGGQNDTETEYCIKRAIYQLPDDLFSEISNECKDMLKKLLQKNPAKRLSASQALEHPWLYNPEEEICDFSLLAETLNSIKEPQNNKKLKELVITLMISQMGKPTNVGKIENFFSVVDTNKDGVISLDELIEKLAMKMPRKDAEEQAEKIMKTLDIDGNGYLDFSEFLRILVEEEVILTKENIKKTFDYLDKNASNKIERDDLKDWLNKSQTVSDSIILELMNEADKNGDGKIDYGEFEELLVSKLELFR